MTCHTHLPQDLQQETDRGFVGRTCDSATSKGSRSKTPKSRPLPNHASQKASGWTPFHRRRTVRSIHEGRTGLAKAATTKIESSESGVYRLGDYPAHAPSRAEISVFLRRTSPAAPPRNSKSKCRNLCGCSCRAPFFPLSSRPLLRPLRSPVVKSSSWLSPPTQKSHFLSLAGASASDMIPRFAIAPGWPNPSRRFFLRFGRMQNPMNLGVFAPDGDRT